MPVTATLRLTRAGDDIVRLNAVLADLFAGAGTEPAVAGDMKLCLNEALANVMAYGETAGEPLRIDVRVSAGGGTVRAVVEDNCALFDPLAQPPARPITGLEDAQVGGFGIALIRDTARDVLWEPLGHRGNRLTLVCGAA
jgi:anti-sigma regulatory factor (Ser/Thr protein kinase)